MRISQIALEAYGVFKDRTITFKPDVALTVVHGSNEAGKTTALSAIADLLFGIEPRSDYGFLHGLKSMSLGASLTSPDGTEVAVRRLKRQARTLVDRATGAPLPDDALAVFLKGRSRKNFLDVFGLDRKRLRAGGEQLMLGGGDIADSLVAATPGLGNVLAIRDALKRDTLKVHNHQHKTQSTDFQQASNKREAARRSIRELEVRADDVKRLRQRAEVAERARTDAIDGQAKAQMELARLDRLQHAAREILAMDRLVSSRASLEPLPDVSAADIAAARSSLQSLAQARRNHETCETELLSAEEALRSIAVDDGLLDFAEAVEAMDERRAAIAGMKQDLFKRRDELATSRGAFARLAASLGVADIDEMIRRLPNDPLLARADRLVDRMNSLEVARSEVTAALRQSEGAREKLDARLAALGPVPDPGAWRARLEALDGCEERAIAAKQARRAADVEEGRLDASAKASGFGTQDLSSLASLPLPTIASASSALQRVIKAEEQHERTLALVRTLGDEETRCRARIAAIRAPGEVPTPAAVETARRSRDSTWNALRPVLSGERERALSDRDMVDDLDVSISHCDRLADARFAGSAHVAELLQAEVALADAGSRLDSARSSAEDQRRSVEAARASWDRLWDGVASTAFEPLERIDGLRAAVEALSQRDRLAALRGDEASRVNASDLDGKRMDALARDLGLSSEGFTVSDVRRAVSAMDARFQERRDAERDVGHNKDARSDLERRQRTLLEEASAIDAESFEVFAAVSARAGAGSAEVKATIELWKEARSLLPTLQQAERRVSRINEEVAEFEAEATELMGRVAVDLKDTDPFISVRQSRTRVEGARHARLRAEDARLNLEVRRNAHDRSKTGFDESLRRNAAILSKFGVAEEGDLPSLLTRVEEGLAIDAERRRVRSRLDEALGGRSEDDVREELGDDDPVALVGLRTVAETVASAAASDVAARIEEDVIARNALAEVEQRGGAAAAAQAEQDAVADMAAAAEAFIRNHTAVRLLAHAIDRYRERHQSPVVERASEAFATLTGGKWQGIFIDYDEEPPILKPKRGDEFLKLKELSEGTADQAFLALRVAAIREHATTNSPLPFIADDLFSTFDEDRTEAGLGLLASLGDATQVILFTHHEHVVESARRTLGERVDIVRL